MRFEVFESYNAITLQRAIQSYLDGFDSDRCEAQVSFHVDEKLEFGYVATVVINIK